jgi:hypothetical protein
MASSTGTSISGAQSVISDVVTTDQVFVVTVGGDSVLPPSRVGYYYLVRYRLSDGLDGRVVNTGAVWRPGVRFRTSDTSSVAAARYRLWVDWNFAGLNWSVATS